MKMTPGSGTIANYASYISNCTLKQFPYKIPVTSLADVQLYIDIGADAPGAATYELIHTCGPDGGTVDTVTPGEYVVGQDTNDNYYGVFRNFASSSATCFVIAITLGTNIYFSEEYCIEPSNCNRELILLQGCYGNLEPLLSYDCEGIYFGPSQGGTLGDATVVYKHELRLRSVEVTLSAIKNTFKQGRTRNFRTEKEKILQFWSEPVPEWYLPDVDAIFYRGEVFIDGVKYLVNETSFEKVDECNKLWSTNATLKESCMQSFSCEADPCGPAVEVPTESGVEPPDSGSESGGEDGGPAIALVGQCLGINSDYIVSGVNPGDVVVVRAYFSGAHTKNGNNFTRANLDITCPDGTPGSAVGDCWTDTVQHTFALNADTTITMVGSTAAVHLAAVVHNSSDSLTSCQLTIISVNGMPTNSGCAGCKGNSSTGGTC